MCNAYFVPTIFYTSMHIIASNVLLPELEILELPKFFNCLPYLLPLLYVLNLVYLIIASLYLKLDSKKGYFS